MKPYLFFVGSVLTAQILSVSTSFATPLEAFPKIRELKCASENMSEVLFALKGNLIIGNYLSIKSRITERETYTINEANYLEVSGSQGYYRILAKDSSDHTGKISTEIKIYGKFNESLVNASASVQDFMADESDVSSLGSPDKLRKLKCDVLY